MTILTPGATGQYYSVERAQELQSRTKLLAPGVQSMPSTWRGLWSGSLELDNCKNCLMS